MRQDIPLSLTGGGDSFDHYHSSDRTPTHDTLQRLHQLDTKRTVAVSPYTVVEQDDILLCSIGGTVNFPASKGNGREIEVIMISVGAVTVVLAGADTVCGETSVFIEEQWTALRFKAVTGGWVLI